MTRMLLALLAVCASARADCVKELDGVVCARGQCAETARGQLICSAVDGGAVFVDVKGIRCYGQCERASVDLCERSVAAR